jgi:DNA invertase Pin-like site-specific DNA recombinase
MTDKPTRRAVAYVRESTEEQGRGYSPDGQRQAIARYAADHGLTLGEEYLDFETGRLADKRPGFQRLIEDAIEHRFDCVLVFHTSRFARNTVEAKRYKKLLRSELGIDVISVTQPLGADADDPAAFLSESVHEIFDEYYSVSLSFWTKMGLREKARQGLLTGSLPWGYVKGEDRIAQPDPEKAPYVRRLFEMYASGQHTDRTLAEWLNVNEQRTTRGRSFGVDTVREMLCNTSYCGYVSARRDKTKAIKGLHEPIVEEALFDRVQGMRRERARTLKPGRPSQRYLLRGLARCERCQGKMQGTAIGRKLVPRYYCASRRADHSCDQPLIHADLVEAQLVEFVGDFKPAPAICDEILHRLAGTATADTTEATQRRGALEERQRRSRDLYEIGDLTRPEYMARRDAVNTELAQLAPEPIPDLDQARQVLDDFSIFWSRETDPAAKRQLLSLIFERVWLDEQRVVAVQPKRPFLPFFEGQANQANARETATSGVCKERERRGSSPRLSPRGSRSESRATAA